MKCDGTGAETRFRLSAKLTSPFKSVGASVQSTTGSRGVRISGSNARYNMFRGSVKGTGYPFHSPVSPFTSPPVRHRVPSHFNCTLPAYSTVDVTCINSQFWHTSLCCQSHNSKLINTFCYLILKTWGTWLRHCATSQKVTGLIPEGVTGIFRSHNPSSHTTALGMTQPLTEMSSRNISWGVNLAGA